LVIPGVVTTNFFKNAIGGTPVVGRAGAIAGSQTPEEVAEVIAKVIGEPQPEVYTNTTSAESARRYLEDVSGFEANLRHRSS
jgi:short-subunit dehydrogenase